jgi:hypothetical protein
MDINFISWSENINLWNYRGNMKYSVNLLENNKIINVEFIKIKMKLIIRKSLKSLQTIGNSEIFI